MGLLRILLAVALAVAAAACEARPHAELLPVRPDWTPAPISSPAHALAVVFVRREAGAAGAAAGVDLMLYDVGEDDVTALTSDPERAERLPRFRSSERVTFLRRDARTESFPRETLYQVTRRGERPQALHVFDGMTVQDYDWSPDGRRLAYVARGRRGEHRLGVLDAETRADAELRRLEARQGAERGDDEIDVEWSRAGDAVLLVDTLLTEEAVHVVRADGSAGIAPVAGTGATWSPDDRAVFYRDTEERPARQALVLAGEQHAKLSLPPAARRPAVSPDGRKIAYDTGGDLPMTFAHDLLGRSDRAVAREAVPLAWISPDELLVVDISSCSVRRCDGTRWALDGSARIVEVGGARTRTVPLAPALRPGIGRFEADVLYG